MPFSCIKFVKTATNKNRERIQGFTGPVFLEETASKNQDDGTRHCFYPLPLVTYYKEEVT
jgi:hypothetical protein